MESSIEGGRRLEGKDMAATKEGGVRVQATAEEPLRATQGNNGGEQGRHRCRQASRRPCVEASGKQETACCSSSSAPTRRLRGETPVQDCSENITATIGPSGIRPGPATAPAARVSKPAAAAPATCVSKTAATAAEPGGAKAAVHVSRCQSPGDTLCTSISIQEQ